MATNRQGNISTVEAEHVFLMSSLPTCLEVGSIVVILYYSFQPSVVKSFLTKKCNLTSIVFAKKRGHACILAYFLYVA